MLTAGFQRLLSEIKKRKEEKKKTISWSLLRAVTGVPQMLGDGGRSQIYSLVIADDAIQRVGRLADIGGRCGAGRGEAKGDGVQRRVGFRDYSPWAENQSRQSEAGAIRDVVRVEDGGAGRMLSPTSTSPSHHFNFSPPGEIWCVSCVILISSMSGHLPVSFNLRCCTTATAVSTCPGRYK